MLRVPNPGPLVCRLGKHVLLWHQEAVGWHGFWYFEAKKYLNYSYSSISPSLPTTYINPSLLHLHPITLPSVYPSHSFIIPTSESLPLFKITCAVPYSMTHISRVTLSIPYLFTKWYIVLSIHYIKRYQTISE